MPYVLYASAAAGIAILVIGLCLTRRKTSTTRPYVAIVDRLPVTQAEYEAVLAGLPETARERVVAALAQQGPPADAIPAAIDFTLAVQAYRASRGNE